MSKTQSWDLPEIPISQKQFHTITEAASDTALAWGQSLLGAFAIFIIGWYVARWSTKATASALAHLPHVDETLRPLILSLLHYGILAATVMAVLARFGVETTSMVALLGAAGIAIGLALQGTLSNVAAGVMLLFLRPFRVGEYIKVNGDEGTVTEIGLFTTELSTAENIYLSLPNSTVWGSPIINYSRNPLRRLDLIFRVAYGSDIGGALTILEKIMEADGRFVRDPPRLVTVHTLGPSSIDLLMRGWVPTELYWDMRWALPRVGLEALQRAGYPVPMPLQRIALLREDEDLTGC